MMNNEYRTINQYKTQYVSDVCKVRGVQGLIVLLKSFNFLHVEVELEADGYVQGDTGQLENTFHRRQLKTGLNLYFQKVALSSPI